METRMKPALGVASLLASILAVSLPSLAPAQTAKPSLSGRWVVAADFYGTPRYYRLELDQEADKLTGKFGGDLLEGTLSSNSVHFLAKDEQGKTTEATAPLKAPPPSPEPWSRSTSTRRSIPSLSPSPPRSLHPVLSRRRSATSSPPRSSTG